MKNSIDKQQIVVYTTNSSERRRDMNITLIVVKIGINPIKKYKK